MRLLDTVSNSGGRLTNAGSVAIMDTLDVLLTVLRSLRRVELPGSPGDDVVF